VIEARDARVGGQTRLNGPLNEPPGCSAAAAVPISLALNPMGSLKPYEVSVF